MKHLSSELQACIETCMHCYQTCFGMAMGHCLEQGGRHVAPEHFRLMMACAEICRAAAQVMLAGTPLHAKSCAACAEICEACAADCEKLEGMEECVAACRRCAQSCRKMAA